MFKWIKYSFLYLSIVFLLTSCATGSYMQIAPTLDKGEEEVTTSISTVIPSIPGPSIMYRRGLSKRADFGIGYYMALWGQIRLDYKREAWISKNKKHYISYGLAVEGYLPDEWADEKDLGLSPSFYYSYKADRVWWYGGARGTFRILDFPALPQYYTLRMEDLSDPSNYELNNRFMWSVAVGIKSKRSNKRFQFYGEIAVLYTLEHTISAFYVDEVQEQKLTRRIYRSLRPEVSIGKKF